MDWKTCLSSVYRCVWIAIFWFHVSTIINDEFFVQSRSNTFLEPTRTKEWEHSFLLKGENGAFNIFVLTFERMQDRWTPSKIFVIVCLVNAHPYLPTNYVRLIYNTCVYVRWVGWKRYLRVFIEGFTKVGD